MLLHSLSIIRLRYSLTIAHSPRRPVPLIWRLIALAMSANYSWIELIGSSNIELCGVRPFEESGPARAGPAKSGLRSNTLGRIEGSPIGKASLLVTLRSGGLSIRVALALT